MKIRSYRTHLSLCGAVIILLFGTTHLARAQSPPSCERTITADVVALDQVFFWNRLGAVQPQGMIFALRRDIVAVDPGSGIVAGNVQLRSNKRPRPIVLRMNVGDCLRINFQNLLNPTPVDNEQPRTRTASVHVTGMQLVGNIASDGSNVGQNVSSLVAPGGSATYTFYAEREGGFMLYSTAANVGGEGDGGQLNAGLFGSVNVQARSAEWYRSQVTADDLALATKKDTSGNPMTTPGGQPIVDYDAVYPAGHPRAGLPILKMTQNNEIVHTDANAIITGPNAGRFPAGTYRPNPVEPDREQPFREFTVIYHDEIGAVQAFPQFEQQPLKHTLHGVRDAFAFNYGTGGIGAEIIANRLGVGPMHNCTECKYEEFFLTSWAVGDPAQVVDQPANTKDASGNLKLGPKATKVLYPDDPSNVYHSYLRDHVKMRVLHGGSKEHHIHHLHAHQWLHTPDSDNSAYLDSQALGPGTGFTTEITHNGSGNRNQTVGDSIFHCHFYPHFAMGMWALWRVHDVFETGTPVDGEGIPVAGSRALPDGEIAAGTPIPGLVPLPTLAMAPMPQAQVSIVNGNAVIEGTGNPGYPFFVPGQAGHRPPHPPLDTVDDGGLPRHIITDGTTHHVETRLDFDKVLLTANAQAVPETGAPVEVAAMNFHAQRQHPSFKPDGTPANFITNGLPPQPGAPFADPCMDDNGNPTGRPRTYKAAVFQFDIKLNKAGWHFPQQRMLALWDDVAPTIAGTRPPEPFFFRANTNDCITFYHTNLVPNIYALDDYQVRTPTDIIGQHIHLVKFDVMASDGAGNGWNYEDGTFSPDEVLERIHAINETGGLLPFGGGQKTVLQAQPHPFFGTVGAQTTVQRWFADNVLNNLGKDRTLRTVFTHDHFGPSTHQQVGLYAGLVIEPEGSQWRHSQTGVIFGSRFDGGPTSFLADILTPNPTDSYREFMLEFADFQHAYKPGGGIDAQGKPVPDPDNVINGPAKEEADLPFLLKPMQDCPGPNGTRLPLPCPEAISAAEPGTQVVNYRNEPVALRVRDPENNKQAEGDKGDLSKVFLSNITRADAALNVQPNFYPPLTGGVQPGDPYTPLLRAYEEDRVQIRMLVGAHEEGHNFNFNGIKWLFEPSDPNSGFKSSQMAGISEHFEFIVPGLAAVKGGIPFADYLYQPSATADGQWNGVWGMLRAYNGGDGLQPDLLPLPSNPDGKAMSPVNKGDFSGVCPRNAPSRNISITAVTAQQALPGGKLIYNSRTTNNGPLNDPTAILYVRSADIDSKTGKLKAGVPVEPLVIRANAGECINVTLTNKLPATLPDLDGFNTLPMIVNFFNANQVLPSSNVGLHAQLLAYDQTESDGANVGFNPIQTAAPGGGIVKYKWYAGDLRMNSSNALVATPVEFGAIALISSDPIKHTNKGAIGSLIIEPQGSTWVEDANSRSQATVTVPGQGSFREFVLQYQTDINLRFGDGSPVPLTANQEDAEDSGQKGFNYRSEPIWFRMGNPPDAPLTFTRTVDFTNALSNSQVGGDPQTPIFTAKVGTPVRFRVLQSGGHQRNNVFLLHGHVWQEEPWTNGSTRIGSNPLSEFYGNQWGFGASSNFNIVPQNGAGGKFRVTGDYLYKTLSGFQFDGGLWGIFRVTP